MKKAIGLFFILTVSTIFVSAFEHPASEFVINIDGIDRTLEYAINNDLFKGNHVYAGPLILPPQSHSANEIWLTIGSGEGRFIDSLNSVGICKETPTLSYSSAPSYPYFHYAKQIQVLSGVNLQEVIDTSSLVALDGVWSSYTDWSSCSVSCGEGTKTRTRTCTNPAPFCGGEYCTDSNIDSTSCNLGACAVYRWTSVAWDSISSYIIQPYNTWGACGLSGLVCSVPNNAVICTPPRSRVMVNSYIACI